MNDYNAAERSHVKAAAKDARIRQNLDDEVVRGIMSGPYGRAYICGLLERAHVFASSFDRNALSMAFAEGERNQGLQLLADIMRACPDQYVHMMRERDERQHAADSRRRDPAADGYGGVEGSVAASDTGPDPGPATADAEN